MTLGELTALAGREIGASAWRAIDQDDISRFARLTGDQQWVHVDIERAKRERGGTVAQGLLLLSLLPSLEAQIMRVTASRVVNAGFSTVRFITPVKSGAYIRLRMTLAGTEERPGGILATRICTIDIAGESEPALSAEMLTLYCA
jgi:acyl dehydratase